MEAEASTISSAPLPALVHMAVAIHGPRLVADVLSLSAAEVVEIMRGHRLPGPRAAAMRQALLGLLDARAA
jgi:hypothetical protein